MKLKTHHPIYKLQGPMLYLDLPLLLLLLALMAFGLVILYSASNQNMHMLTRQGLRLLLALTVMIGFACIPPHKYKAWTPWIFGLGLLLLIAVMIMGKIGKGAQRWLDLGLLRFQPSEIMKLAVPMFSAWLIDKYELPISFKTVILTGIFIAIPAFFDCQAT